ncbi:MAG: hypothetical protein PHC34_08725 [Candidatus Gastranaerophilales bacterium]|nr:hypothetical protein [Candidatus Gastranaerophilales bacterium]
MQSGSLNNFIKLINYRVSFKNIYHFLLQRLTGLKISIKNSNIDSFQVKIRTSEKFASKMPAIKEFNPIFVLVKEKIIDCNVIIRDMGIDFRLNIPNIHHMTPIDNKIKWKHPDLLSLNVIRNYPLQLESNFRDLNIADLMLSSPEVLNFAYDEIRLAEKVRVTEEIIAMSPYVKEPSRSVLFRIPVIKKPLSKSYFTEEEMDIFRESLATHNKTKKINVKISNIYDKFNIELFSSIKLEPNSKNLICHLNNKIMKIDKEKLYYLILGERKDNKVSIKSLARLDKK